MNTDPIRVHLCSSVVFAHAFGCGFAASWNSGPIEPPLFTTETRSTRRTLC